LIACGTLIGLAVAFGYYVYTLDDRIVQTRVEKPIKIPDKAWESDKYSPPKPPARAKSPPPK
jgi:hypothetical protein